jgi:hypothetical protein
VRVERLDRAALVDDEVDRDVAVAHAHAAAVAEAHERRPGAMRVRSCSLPSRRSQTAHHELCAGPTAAVAAQSMSSSENAAT